MSFDPALFGTWLAPNGSKIELNSDGWSYSLSTIDYSMAPDGMSVDFTSLNPPETFTRVYGNGPSLIGVWHRSTTLDGTVWLEEKHFRPDDTFTIQWTADGVFDSLYMGTFQDSLLSFDQKERRALVSTSANVIFFEPPFGPNYAGTYTVDAVNNTWTLTLAGVDYVYQATTFP